jgi:hypothetical protein
MKGFVMASILESISAILNCSKDIQDVVDTVKDSLEDGKITPAEFLSILESIVGCIGSITRSALDIKDTVG